MPPKVSIDDAANGKISWHTHDTEVASKALGRPVKGDEELVCCFASHMAIVQLAQMRLENKF